MFLTDRSEIGKSYRPAVIGLSLLCAMTLAITIWVMVDFLKEQSIVADLMKGPPHDAKDSAEVLAGELRWQFRLTILVVLSVIVTAIAVILLWRAFHTSQTLLREFKALASDVLSGMEQGVVTTDNDGIVTSINRRGMEILDADLSCIGKRSDQFSSVPLQQYVDDWMTERSPSQIRELSVAHGGNFRKLRAYCQMLNDHEGAEVCNVLQLRNTTEQGLIENRMRRMQHYKGRGQSQVGYITRSRTHWQRYRCTSSCWKNKWRKTAQRRNTSRC